MRNRILDKISEFNNIAIVGFGKEGKSTYNFIRSRLTDIKLTIIDKVNAYDMMENLKDDQNLDVVYGDNYLNDLDRFDLIFKSPGVSFKELDRDGMSKKITSQVEMVLSEIRDRTVAVTGSKGKSTTSSLIHHLIKEQGKKTLLVGNIGVPVFDEVDNSVCILYVPYGAKDAYATAKGWKNFRKIIELAPEEITITISGYGSATYCSDFALDFSNVEGLKAYAATGYNVNTGVVTLTRLQTAREGTGLFLKGKPGKYTVPVLEETGDHSLNMLVGTLKETTVDSSDDLYANYKYTINEGTSTPMFYQFADGSSLSANKAYLQIPLAWLKASASKSVEIRFDDGETTDIDEVEGENGDAETVYDLQGRAVENPTKGIYIVDGKKVFIK